jgi:hypothetical protein
MTGEKQVGVQQVEQSLIDLRTTLEQFVVEDANVAVLTGFIDVEKIFRLGFERFFLEKKLPFQVIIIRKSVFGETA